MEDGYFCAGVAPMSKAVQFSAIPVRTGSANFGKKRRASSTLYLHTRETAPADKHFGGVLKYKTRGASRTCYKGRVPPNTHGGTRLLDPRGGLVCFQSMVRPRCFAN